jgi:hypothetical protein
MRVRFTEAYRELTAANDPDLLPFIGAVGEVKEPTVLFDAEGALWRPVGWWRSPRATSRASSASSSRYCRETLRTGLSWPHWPHASRERCENGSTTRFSSTSVWLEWTSRVLFRLV